MKNFRVVFKFDEEEQHIDFSMEGKIDSETKAISASDEIRKRYPGVDGDRFEIINIYECNIW